MSFTGLLNAEMVVLLPTISATTYGGQTPTISTVYSQRPCRIAQLSMAERDILKRQGVESTHRVFCEADMTLSTQHEIVISGSTYEVTGFSSPEGAVLAHHSEVLVKRQS